MKTAKDLLAENIDQINIWLNKSGAKLLIAQKVRLLTAIEKIIKKETYTDAQWDINKPMPHLAKLNNVHNIENHIDKLVNWAKENPGTNFEIKRLNVTLSRVSAIATYTKEEENNLLPEISAEGKETAVKNYLSAKRHYIELMDDYESKSNTYINAKEELAGIEGKLVNNNAFKNYEKSTGNNAKRQYTKFTESVLKQLKNEMELLYDKLQNYIGSPAHNELFPFDYQNAYWLACKAYHNYKFNWSKKMLADIEAGFEASKKHLNGAEKELQKYFEPTSVAYHEIINKNK